MHLPTPWKILAALAWAGLRGKKRSFHKDARACTALLEPPLQVIGTENIPPAGPYVVTINHYTRPGFSAWWLALAVSSALPDDVHWIVTEAWSYPDALRARLVTPATRWAFRRMAAVYGFTSMPPMPPRPEQVQARALAVRQVLAYTRRTPQVVIGLAPEGSDSPGGVLRRPPPGVGRFILHLAEQGLRILPAGIYEENSRLCLHFGEAYRLDIPPNLAPAQRDRLVSQAVMTRIARLLPVRLRGDFAYNTA